MAKKSLGQHFLKCNWVVDTMLHAANIGPHDSVLEIGPGTGALTRALGASAGQVIAVEKDKGLANELRTTLEKEKVSNIKIIPGDILRAFSGIANAYGLRPNAYKIVANIPYYLTSRLLRIIFDEKRKPQVIILTIQKEVAQRLCAKPPHMNLLALSEQFFGAPQIIKTVPASCFLPQPNVESAIIKIIPHQAQHTSKNDDIDAVFSAAKPAFSQKRKILVRSLRNIFSKINLEECLNECQLSMQSRPEELSLSQWIAFARCLEKYQDARK